MPIPNNPLAAIYVERLKLRLFLDETALASLMGISRRVLSAWSGLSVLSLPPKGQRLIRLDNVVEELLVTLPRYGMAISLVGSVLIDGRVPMDGGGDEASMSLLSYLCAFPKDGGWMANVRAATEEYLDFLNNNSR